MAVKRDITCGGEAMVSTLDRITAGLLLVYFAPLMLAVTLLVKVDSRGPVLARRRDLADDGRPVELLEFRTMAAERAKCGVVSLFVHQYTPLGTFLRVSRLNLLPRLFNALRGDISFMELLR